MKGLMNGRALAAGSMLWVVCMAIGCGDDEPKSGNGVNDVKLACEIRATWNRGNPDCAVCESAAVSPRCECSELAAFSAACIEQQDARRAVCAESVDNCVFACRREDCACVEACYAAGDACKKASDARDGCVSEACASHCK